MRLFFDKDIAFDLETNSDTKIITIVEGQITISPSIEEKQVIESVKTQSCIDCIHFSQETTWTCPSSALKWADELGLKDEDIDWPVDAEPCPGFYGIKNGIS